MKDLLNPWVVLPAQCEPGPAWPPERRLVLAVLEEAVANILKYPSPSLAPATRRDAPSVREKALSWLESNDVQWPYSFRNICAHLGLEPDRIRAAIRARAGQSWTQTRHQMAGQHGKGRIREHRMRRRRCGPQDPKWEGPAL